MDADRRLRFAGGDAAPRTHSARRLYPPPAKRWGGPISIALAAPAGTFHGLFLTADLATRLSRVGGRKGDASDADAAVAREQEHYDLGVLQWTSVDASGSPDETLRRAKAALGLA